LVDPLPVVKLQVFILQLGSSLVGTLTLASTPCPRHRIRDVSVVHHEAWMMRRILGLSVVVVAGCYFSEIFWLAILLWLGFNIPGFLDSLRNTDNRNPYGEAAVQHYLVPFKLSKRVWNG
jgi:hypothetical protein